MYGLMPGSIHPQLTGIDTVRNSRNQQTGEPDSDTQRVECALRSVFIAVFEQENEAAEKTGDNANQQQNDHNFDIHALLARSVGSGDPL